MEDPEGWPEPPQLCRLKGSVRNDDDFDLLVAPKKVHVMHAEWLCITTV